VRSQSLTHRSRRSFSRAATVLACALVARLAEAQAGTDIHLIALTIRDSVVTLGTPINITARPGYDNQPSFSSDGRAILFTSVRSDGQSDIYRYDIGTGATTQVTRTPESEYSATVMPGGQRFSVIRVERDSTQRLWSFAMDGTDPRLVLSNVKPVGYHAWANDTTLGLFVLGSPATLQIANARTGESRVVAGGTGRGIFRIPGTSLISVTGTDSTGVRWIERVDPVRDQRVRLVQARPRSEDYGWTPDGSIIMAQANALHRWRGPAVGASGGALPPWVEIATFAQPNLQAITRLAVSPGGDWLAIVAAEPR
jgi:dipeptidyl aminopeptidase/acylaminoacyl peptidase